MFDAEANASNDRGELFIQSMHGQDFQNKCWPIYSWRAGRRLPDVDHKVGLNRTLTRCG